jgi:phospholipid-binding lipoprotein MlaA
MSGRRRPTVLRAATAAALLAAVAGCATVREGAAGPGQKLDPWENWNRKVFGFNEGLDERVLKPVATAYSKVVPQPVRTALGNFFANAADLWSGVNNVLQAKPEAASRDFVRFGANTVFGVLGFFDVASEMGLDHQYEDFGQTLGRWGVGPGAYMVLPVFGPSTVRETAAFPLDRFVSPALLLDSTGERLVVYTVQFVNTRANLLGASRVIDDIALDKYTFIRDAYLQRRRSLVFDGDAPDPGPGPDAAASPAAPPAAGAPASAPASSASQPGL